jgi:hypothetical protein
MIAFLREENILQGIENNVLGKSEGWSEECRVCMDEELDILYTPRSFFVVQSSTLERAGNVRIRKKGNV